MKRIYLFVVVCSCIIFFNSCSQSGKMGIDTSSLINVAQQKKSLLFGFDLDKYEAVYDTVRKGWTWNDLFAAFDVDQYKVNKTVQRLKDSLIGLKYMIAGKPFVLFKKKDEGSSVPTHLVYEPDAFTYILFNFENETIDIKKDYRPVETKERTITGVIEKNSNLSVELNKNFDSYSMTTSLSSALEGIYAWSVDFFRLQENDKFVVVFDEKCINGKPYTVDQIKYAWFEHSGEGLYAFYYNDSTQDVSGFYNELGNAMKRRFLQAPVEYSRISSPYDLHRFHPILKTDRPHLGTDYAAPTGTPIHSTADGIIEIAGHTWGNGNYVKVRHNATYETQYLHMSKIGAGIKHGVHVKQGEVIGYVGQTGLATGPHVCYRFWKNGKQIDPRSEKFTKTEPMKEEVKPEYLEYIVPLKKYLDKSILELKQSTPKESEPVI